MDEVSQQRPYFTFLRSLTELFHGQSLICESPPNGYSNKVELIKEII